MVGAVVRKHAMVCLAALLLAGCVQEEALPRILEIKRFAPTFDEERILVQTSFQNVGSVNAYGAFLRSAIHTLVADPSHNAGVRGTGDYDAVDLHLSPTEANPFPDVIYSSNAWNTLPPENRTRQFPYFGPFKLAPGEYLNLTIAFHVQSNFSGNEGYYSGRIALEHFHNDTNRGDSIWVGCFNRDTPVFYGEKEGQIPCPTRHLDGSRVPLPMRESRVRFD